MGQSDALTLNSFTLYFSYMEMLLSPHIELFWKKTLLPKSSIFSWILSFQNSVPIEVEIVEESPAGTVVGTVRAVDADEGENAIIDYAIIGEAMFFLHWIVLSQTTPP